MTENFIETPCPNSNFQLNPTEETTYCAYCDKDVQNLALMTEAEAWEWNQKNRGRCVAVAKDDDGALVFKPSATIKTIVLSLSALVIVSSGTGYAEIASIVVSRTVQAEPTLADKTFVTVDMVVSRSAAKFGNIVKSLTPKTITPKFQAGANDVVTSQVVF